MYVDPFTQYVSAFFSQAPTLFSGQSRLESCRSTAPPPSENVRQGGQLETFPSVAAAKIRPRQRFHALGRERQYAKVAEGNRRDDRARRRKREQEEALMSRMREQSKVRRLTAVSSVSTRLPMVSTERILEQLVKG